MCKKEVKMFEKNHQKNISEKLVIKENYNIDIKKLKIQEQQNERDPLEDPVWDVCRFTQRVVHPWSDRDFKRQWGMIPDLSLAAPLAIGAAMKIAPMVQYVLMNVHQM